MLNVVMRVTGVMRGARVAVVVMVMTVIRVV